MFVQENVQVLNWTECWRGKLLLPLFVPAPCWCACRKSCRCLSITIAAFHLAQNLLEILARRIIYCMQFSCKIGLIRPLVLLTDVRRTVKCFQELHASSRCNRATFTDHLGPRLPYCLPTRQSAFYSVDIVQKNEAIINSWDSKIRVLHLSSMDSASFLFCMTIGRYQSWKIA